MDEKGSTDLSELSNSRDSGFEWGDFDLGYGIVLGVGVGLAMGLYSRGSERAGDGIRLIGGSGRVGGCGEVSPEDRGHQYPLDALLAWPLEQQDNHAPQLWRSDTGKSSSLSGM